MKKPHYKAFAIAFVLWLLVISAELNRFLPESLGKLCIFLLLPEIIIGGSLDMAGAPEFMMSPTHGVTFLKMPGKLLVFGIPALGFFVRGLVLMKRCALSPEQNESGEDRC